MSSLIEASGLSKSYGSTRAVDNVSFDVQRGRILGLIGPNGAGKTTLLNAVLGLTSFSGDLSVLGLDPFKQRKSLMQRIAYVSDVAVLPKWITAARLFDYVATMHSGFDRAQAEKLLADTKVKPGAKVGSLSKGMIVQLHLAIIMSINAELLILDEPTLGLDILFRKDFYSRLLGDYYDGEKTIIVTTHQVDELEHILTDVMFIDDGRIALDATIESIENRYVELMTSGEYADAANKLGPVSVRKGFGKQIMLFDGIERDQLREFGETRKPSISDLFVAILRGDTA
ncbi:MAG: ABC transporter ATP-binding protein [Pseudomonadota bacterium]